MFSNPTEFGTRYLVDRKHPIGKSLLLRLREVEIIAIVGSTLFAITR